MLCIIVALIASSAKFGELTEASVYIVAGFMILAIHAVGMLLAKLFKIDLFTCCIASCATVPFQLSKLIVHLYHYTISIKIEESISIHNTLFLCYIRIRQWSMSVISNLWNKRTIGLK
ncbi:DUF819 family protein [Parendozoicomonas callyspongiae]|uniref:DUF819 family protein n=1 Tax=Parendozoicomonas callyspongiae TaxID=2942213 RepID=UPI0038CD9871